jgi:hypothetical protein
VADVSYYYKMPDGGLVERTVDSGLPAPATPPGATPLTPSQYSNTLAEMKTARSAAQTITRDAERNHNRMKYNGLGRMVASASAPQYVKDTAAYVCDGIADQANIQAAVDAALAEGGGTVYLSQGVFFTSAPITLHPLVRLVGVHGDQIFNPNQMTVASYIRPVAGFTGGAVIVMLDQVYGGYAGKSAEQQVHSLTIDGTGVGGTVHGIQAGGYVHGVLLRDVAIKNVTGRGVYTFFENGAQPFSWTFEHVIVDNSEGAGFELINHSDLTMFDVVSIGAGGNAFTISNAPNSRAFGCRAEWSEGYGYDITGHFGTGQGSGGMTFVGCSSDRNRFDGMRVTATGNAPLVINGCTFRRDGRNGNDGGGDYSGFRAVGAGMPLIIDGLSVYPGVDDTGAGVNSPVNAFKASGCTYVALNSGFLHGAVNAFVDGGANTVLRRGPNIGERTGDTDEPVDDFTNPWTSYGDMTLKGYLAADAGQSGGKWSVYGDTRDALNLGSAGGGVAIKEGGTKARMGVATLAAGTVTVPNTSVTVNTRIFLTGQDNGASGTPGTPRVSARVAGTGFTISSSSATDTSTVAWELKEPAA